MGFPEEIVVRYITSVGQQQVNLLMMCSILGQHLALAAPENSCERAGGKPAQ